MHNLVTFAAMPDYVSKYIVINSEETPLRSENGEQNRRILGSTEK